MELTQPLEDDMIRMIDCFMPLIVYVVCTVKHIDEDQPDFDTVKSNIDDLLNQSLGKKDEAGFPDSDYDYARLAVCVWIDEALLNSSWMHKRPWQLELLQLRYYNMTDGGETFFEKLERLGHEDRAVREVAYYCLTLGLSGRYIEKGDDAILDHLKASNLKRLFKGSEEASALENRQLFPEAYHKQTIISARDGGKRTRWALQITVGLLSVGLYAVLMMAYQFLLKLDLEHFVPI